LGWSWRGARPASARALAAEWLSPATRTPVNAEVVPVPFKDPKKKIPKQKVH